MLGIPSVNQPVRRMILDSRQDIIEPVKWIDFMPVPANP